MSDVSSKDRSTLKNYNSEEQNDLIDWYFSLFFWYVFSGFKIPADIMLIPASKMFAPV